MNKPLDTRPSLQTDARPNHPMTKALRDVVRRQALSGAVMLSFKGDRVGVNASAQSDGFGAVMEKLGDLILAKLDDGEFDAALLAAPTEGEA